MTLQSGRFAALKLSSSLGTQPKTVPYLGSWELSITFDSADATVFGDVWKSQMPMVQGWNASVTGYMDVTTACLS